MNTTKPTWATTETSQLTRTGHDRVCRCGQDLDICTRRHCPRCGTTVVDAASLTLAA